MANPLSEDGVFTATEAGNYLQEGKYFTIFELKLKPKKMVKNVLTKKSI